METLQHIVVTLIALGAAILVVGRVFVTLKPSRGKSPCASCDAARGTEVPRR